MRPSFQLATVGELLGASPALAACTAGIRLVDWQRIAGERLAEKAVPERLEDGLLTIRVPSSTWAQEMSMLSELLVQRLASCGHRVKRLRFRVAAPPANRVTLKRVSVSRVPLPSQLTEKLSQLPDEGLKAVVAEAASYSLARLPHASSTSAETKKGPLGSRREGTKR